MIYASKIFAFGCVAVALAVPTQALAGREGGGASARVLHVSWHEKKLMNRGRVSFLISEITLSPGHGWSAVVKITNASPGPVGIVPRQPVAGLASSAGFGLAYKDKRNDGKPLPNPLLAVAATSFTPPLPKVLRVGESWRGRFGSNVSPPAKTDAWLVFGWFAPKTLTEPQFNWITDHSFRT
ncbi:MAG: hypothetical protein H0X39_02460 [Actinobacteria bacterium]|nr:hypothetical protein [Actinomycetota bacterium]